MFRTRFRLLELAALLAFLALQQSWARDLRVTIPKRSQLTPVQRLNREGVEAVQKRRYEKAEALFLKAYQRKAVGRQAHGIRAEWDERRTHARESHQR